MKPMLASGSKKVGLIVNPPAGHPQRTVMVLGVQRGGTSLVAGVIRALGIDFGPAGLNHEDTRFVHAEGEEAFSALVAERNAEHDVWGFKVPHAALEMDFWERTLRNPYYVCVFRNPEAVVESIVARRTGKPPNALTHVVKYYDRIAKLARETSAPMIMLNYERAAENAQGLIDAMIEFLMLTPTEEQKAAALTMVTGDGGGYVNLPSEYFYVGQAAEDAPRSQDAGLQIGEAPGGGEIQITHASGKLPAKLLMRSHLAGAGEGVARVYVNFGSGYTNRLSQDNPVAEGGLISIETNGEAIGARVKLEQPEGAGHTIELYVTG